MGLSEGKRKTRLVGSAVTKNSAWTNDASLPGQRLLSSMGWSQGQGLGTSSQGTAVPITMAFKMDNKGIGARRFEKEARANGVADAWVGGAGQLGDLFERLNKASGSTPPPVLQEIEDADSKSTEEKEKEKKEKGSRKGKGKGKKVDESEAKDDEEKVIEAVEKVASTLPHRMAHRARFLRAKRMVGTDMASVNEILGIASPAGPSSPAPVEVSAMMPIEAVSTDKSSHSNTVDKKADREGKRKRKREGEAIADDKSARKEAKRLAKEVKREEKRKRKEGRSTEEPELVDTIDVISADPSFAAGGGMKVSTLSVHEYLQNQLMKRKAALIRRKREEEASLWNRAATVCT